MNISRWDYRREVLRKNCSMAYCVSIRHRRMIVRIIYLYVVVRSTVYLLTIYAKAQQENLTPAQKKAILSEVATLKGEQQE